MCVQPSEINFQLPSWIADFINNFSKIEDIQKRMSFVIEASGRNVAEQTGGPFAAAIFEKDSGRLVSLGVNLVTTEGMSILHAEMVAFAVSQKKLNTYDLGGRGMANHELVASAEPCAMCFGAIPWSGVRRVITGARDSDTRSIGFDEGPKMVNWKEELENRGIEVICDVQREEAASVLAEYSSYGGRIYNSRETSIENEVVKKSVGSVK